MFSLACIRLLLANLEKIGFGLRGVCVSVFHGSFKKRKRPSAPFIYSYLQNMHSLSEELHVLKIMLLQVVDMLNFYCLTFYNTLSKANSTAGFQSVFFDIVKPKLCDEPGTVGMPSRSRPDVLQKTKQSISDEQSGHFSTNTNAS